MRRELLRKAGSVFGNMLLRGMNGSNRLGIETQMQQIPLTDTEHEAYFLLDAMGKSLQFSESSPRITEINRASLLAADGKVVFIKRENGRYSVDFDNEYDVLHARKVYFILQELVICRPRDFHDRLEVYLQELANTEPIGYGLKESDILHRADTQMKERNGVVYE